MYGQLLRNYFYVWLTVGRIYLRTWKINKGGLRAKSRFHQRCKQKGKRSQQFVCKEKVMYAQTQRSNVQITILARACVHSCFQRGTTLANSGRNYKWSHLRSLDQSSWCFNNTREGENINTRIHVFFFYHWGQTYGAVSFSVPPFIQECNRYQRKFSGEANLDRNILTCDGLALHSKQLTDWIVLRNHTRLNSGITKWTNGPIKRRNTFHQLVHVRFQPSYRENWSLEKIDGISMVLWVHSTPASIVLKCLREQD